MKITDLQIDGFGVWKGLTVESLSDDLTVFCGYNEAGKTTMMQFIRAMMFGFSPERVDKYTPPVYGGLAGGSLDVDTAAGIFEVQRHVDPNRHTDPIGDLAVTDAHDGSVHGRARLSALMSDIDESIFINVFAIGLREIQELGALNSTAAAEQLYKLTSGLDRVSLIDVMRDQRQRRERIWNVEGREESRLGELSEKRQKLMREIDQLKQRSKRWSQVAAEKTDINHQLADLEAAHTQRQQRSRLIEVAMQVAERWHSREVLQQQIAAFGVLPDRRDLALDQLDQLNQRIETQVERIEQIRVQRKTIKAEALALPINRTLWAQKSRIEAVSEHMPWVESLQRQTDRLDGEIDRIEGSLTNEVSGLGYQLEIKPEDIRELNYRGMDTLEKVGNRLVQQQERLETFQAEMEKIEFDLGQHQERLGSSLAERSPTETLEDTGRYVNRLRRRIELEAKIDKLHTSRQDLERDIDVVVNEQVLSVEKLSIIGVVFIGGVILLGLGLIDAFRSEPWLSDQTTTLGLTFIFLGMVAGFVSMALKYHWERAAKEDLDDFRHQIEIIRQQLKRAKRERDEIDKQLPARVSGKWEIELQDAEAQLARMEDLIPLENRVQSTRGTQEEIRRRIAAQQREVEKAEEQWQSSLRTTGLPAALRPHQLKEIAHRAERVSTFYLQLEQFRAEKLERQKELAALQQRIDSLLHDTGMDFDSTTLVERLHQLNRALNEQRQFVKGRQELANKYKSLRSRLNRAKRELEKLLGQKQRLLAVVGAENEQEYRDFEVQHQRRDKVIEQREALSEQIRAAMGKHVAEQDVGKLLTTYGSGGLEQQWEKVQEELEEFKAEQTRLLQTRGELNQEAKLLGEDNRLDVAHLELNAINAEIQQLQQQWQVLAASTQMLELIRESYESKRQPETLKEASGYLARLTEGTYPRIWTRLVGEELLVDNAHGETIPVEKLSRGTREAVFLSLRLALVGAYARRGAVIPMVLDDVLVNFDGHRALAAADLLHDFARNGHQILMFTCHDHMRDMFHQLGADVRILPSHKDVVNAGATPQRYVADLAPRVTRVEEPQPVPPPVVPEPEPVSQGIPVEYIDDSDSRIHLEPDDYDAELEYELSAVSSDLQAERQLRDELVYVSPNLPGPLTLSGDDPIWGASRSLYL